MYRKIIAVCAQIHTKHINILCGQNEELLNVKPGGARWVHWTPRYEHVRRSRVTVSSFLNVSSIWRCMPRPLHPQGMSPPVRTVGPKAGLDIVCSYRETNLSCSVRRAAHQTIRIRFNTKNTARGCVSNTVVQTAHAYDVRNKHVAEWSMEFNKTKFLTLNSTATMTFLRAVWHRSPLYSAHAY
jgi:hypothetical protein